MNGVLQVFQAETGDCMAVSFTGNDHKSHHLLIDAGFEDTFGDTLLPFIEDLLEQDHEACIDLFVITHIDKDHISGMQEFVREFGDKKELVAEFLFNYSPKPFAIFKSQREKNIGVSEGINLRAYLSDIGKLNDQPIVTPYTKDIAGASLILLSPTLKKYERHLQDWENWKGAGKAIDQWEVKERAIGSASTDHNQTIKELIEDFKDSKPKMDTSSNNGSSIAFLFQSGTFSILFLGDAHASVIIQSLKEQLHCTKDQKLKVDYVKLSHHGSKRNTSLQLLELIECFHFIISTDGYSPHHHPHKATFARIIYQRDLYSDEVKRNSPIYFHFNHKNYILDGIMTPEERALHNVHFKFPKHDNRLEIKWT